MEAVMRIESMKVTGLVLIFIFAGSALASSQSLFEQAADKDRKKAIRAERIP